MFGTSTLKGTNRAAWRVSVVVVVACLLMALACIGANLVMWGRRLGVRPVVLHVGRVALSAEITDNPSCAPLTKSCWVLPAGNRAKYFSVWVYMTTPQGVEWHISDWHAIVLRLGPEGPPEPTGP